MYNAQQGQEKGHRQEEEREIKVKILEPGQGCELLSLADLGFSNRLWSLEHI